jgi:gamma-glutamyltranspeptidase/glutathione hydrolase
MKYGKLFLFLTLLLVSCTHKSVEKALDFGVISSASPEASMAGIEILRKGGNAIDAAVAISFVLGVTEPAMSGLGGGTQILFALPGEKPITINGATLSPTATPTDATKADLTYHRRSTIPSTVKVLAYAWKKYGSGKIAWAELLAPAIQYAEEGFEVGTFRHKVYKKYEKILKESPHQTHFFLMPDGNIPAPGDILKQPLLAKTLLLLAKNGGDDFYFGEIAKMIADDMIGNGGWITLQDLNQFPEPIELKSLHTSYRNYDIYSQPPPCGGWTVLLALNILENFPPEDLQFETQSRFEKILHALHLAHQDRKNTPVTDLVNYQSSVEKKLSKEYAKQLLEKYQAPATSAFDDEKGGETTHFSVVDKDGLTVAVTASINAYFGAAAASSELGFLYNTYMNDFTLGEPEHPFAIRPGLMNYSSMSPTIVQKDDESVLVIGSPGSARIISAVAQLTQLWIDQEMSIEEVVAAPRLHSVNDKIYFEKIDIPEKWRTHFRDQGFEIAFPAYDLTTGKLNAYFGGVHAVAKENGQWVGAADPRRDGKVISN